MKNWVVLAKSVDYPDTPRIKFYVRANNVEWHNNFTILSADDVTMEFPFGLVGFGLADHFEDGPVPKV